MLQGCSHPAQHRQSASAVPAPAPAIAIATAVPATPAATQPRTAMPSFSLCLDIGSFTVATIGPAAEPIATVRSGIPGLYKVLVEELTPSSPSSDLQPLTDWLPFTVFAAAADADADSVGLLLTPLLDPDAVPDPATDPATDPAPETVPLIPGRYELRVEVADQSYRTRSDNIGCALLVAELSVVLAVLPSLVAWAITRSWTPLTVLAGWAAFAGAVHLVRDLRRSRLPPDPPHDYRIAIRPSGAPRPRPSGAPKPRSRPS